MTPFWHMCLPTSQGIMWIYKRGMGTPILQQLFFFKCNKNASNDNVETISKGRLTNLVNQLPFHMSELCSQSYSVAFKCSKIYCCAVFMLDWLYLVIHSDPVLVISSL